MPVPGQEQGEPGAEVSEQASRHGPGVAEFWSC